MSDKNHKNKIKDDAEQKKLNRMQIIYAALEDGWTVKKSDINPKTFEFTKNQSLDIHYRGLIILSNKTTICEEIQKHLGALSCHKELNHKTKKRSISAPILKS